MLRHSLLYRGVTLSIEQCVAFPLPMDAYFCDPLPASINSVSSTSPLEYLLRRGHNLAMYSASLMLFRAASLDLFVLSLPH